MALGGLDVLVLSSAAFFVDTAPCVGGPGDRKPKGEEAIGLQPAVGGEDAAIASPPPLHAAREQCTPECTRLKKMHGAHARGLEVERLNFHLRLTSGPAKVAGLTPPRGGG